MGDGLTMSWAADDRRLVALQGGIGSGANWLEIRTRVPLICRSRLNGSRLTANPSGWAWADYQHKGGKEDLRQLDDEYKRAVSAEDHKRVLLQTRELMPY
jgi:hypothetical protein